MTATQPVMGKAPKPKPKVILRRRDGTTVEQGLTPKVYTDQNMAIVDGIKWLESTFPGDLTLQYDFVGSAFRGMLSYQDKTLQVMMEGWMRQPRGANTHQVLASPKTTSKEG